MRKSREILRKLICAAVSLCLCSGTVLPVSAETDSGAQQEDHMSYYYEPAESDSIKGWPDSPGIEAQSAMVIDLANGSILYAKNADLVRYPASITKIMTCLIACEHLDPNMHFVMSESAAFGIEAGSSSIYASPDEEFTVEQAEMALMLESANEMGLMLAELTAGSEKKFIEMMNERAAQLGCTNTHFNNPHGLPDENHYTTAHDMALIAKAAWNNPSFRKLVMTQYYNIPPTNKQPETRYMQNHHRMMKDRNRAYDGVVGGKTGYTQAAGNTLVTYCRRGSIGVAVVVLNSIDGGYGDTAELLDYVYANFERIYLKVVPSRIDVLENPLPWIKSLAADPRTSRSFQVLTGASATVPIGVTARELRRFWRVDRTLMGLPTVWNEYYYNGNLVGQARQFMQTVLPMSDLNLP